MDGWSSEHPFFRIREPGTLDLLKFPLQERRKAEAAQRAEEHAPPRITHLGILSADPAEFDVSRLSENPKSCGISNILRGSSLNDFSCLTPIFSDP